MPERWIALCGRLEVEASPLSVEEVYRQLAERYAEPHRAYHNLDHIEHCLDEFEPLRPTCAHPEHVEAAIWFHDAIYDTRAADSEERSADFAQRTLRDLGLEPRVCESVGSLILATTHEASPSSADESALVDVDLAILGQPPGVFDEYERAIRVEYAWVDDRTFAAGRRRILHVFLQRPHIYATELFRPRYEAAARANLQRSITRLEAAPDVS